MGPGGDGESTGRGGDGGGRGGLEIGRKKGGGGGGGVKMAPQPAAGLRGLDGTAEALRRLQLALVRQQQGQVQPGHGP